MQIIRSTCTNNLAVNCLASQTEITAFFSSRVSSVSLCGIYKIHAVYSLLKKIQSKKHEKYDIFEI